MQPNIPARLTVRAGVGDIFVRILPFDLITFHLHQLDEVLFADGVAHRFVDRNRQIQLPALTFFSYMILCGGHTFDLFALGNDHRKAVFHTELVRGVAQTLDFMVIGMELQTLLRVHRIDNKVRMYVVTVDVSGDQHLIAGEVFFGKTQSNFVRGLRCNRLIRVEGLHDVIVLSAARFAVLQLGIHHFIERGLRYAVDSGD